MAIVHGGASNVELSFDAVASRPMGEVLEPKICEKCTRQFFRGVLLAPALRDKLCPGCRARKKASAGVQ